MPGHVEKIFGLPISPFSMRIEMMLRAKASDLQLTPPPDGVRSDAYRALASIGKIPAMQLGGGRVLGESDVIAEYLEETLDGPALLPEAPAARAEARLTARIADIYVMNRMLPIFTQLDPASRDNALVNRVIGEVTQGLAWLDQQVQSGGEGRDAAYAMAAMVPVLFYVDRILPVFGSSSPLDATGALKALYEREITLEPAKSVVESMARALSEVGL